MRTLSVDSGLERGSSGDKSIGKQRSRRSSLIEVLTSSLRMGDGGDSSQAEKTKRKRKKKKKKKIKLHYHPPEQWRVEDFWPGSCPGLRMPDTNFSLNLSADKGRESLRLDQGVEAQLTSYALLDPNLHNAITTSREEKYDKRDRTRASLLTAGIKAGILAELRDGAEARGRARGEVETMEGRMAQAAFSVLKQEMMGKGKGIRLIKHPRSGKKGRLIRLKMRQIGMSDGGSNGGEEGEGADPDDEFDPSRWDAEGMRDRLDVPTHITYRAGTLDRRRRDIALEDLREVKKGVQTDVLKRNSDNSYRSHCFFSLEFGDALNEDGAEYRTFDLEVPGGDVNLRDRLLHGFRYVAMMNNKRAPRDSWELPDEKIQERLRRAWDGRNSSVDAGLMGQAEQLRNRDAGTGSRDSNIPQCMGRRPSSADYETDSRASSVSLPDSQTTDEDDIHSRRSPITVRSGPPCAPASPPRMTEIKHCLETPLQDKETKAEPLALDKEPATNITRDEHPAKVTNDEFRRSGSFINTVFDDPRDGQMGLDIEE